MRSRRVVVTRAFSALLLAGALGCGRAESPAAAASAGDIQALIDQVPDGASWQDLPASLRASFEANAAQTLARDRREWELPGLEDKLARLQTPTAAMTENIDRVLSIEFASELPEGFSLHRDVTHPELRLALLRIYLDITESRANMLHDHPEFKAWDGGAVREFWYRDHEHHRALRQWAHGTRQIIDALAGDALTPTEGALRDKAGYRLRGYQFDVPHVASVGDIGYASLYKLPAALRPFATDAELLTAYNASMFSRVRHVDKGTLEAFEWNLDTEFDRAWLTDQNMPEPLVKSILTLGRLFRTRMLAHPDANTRCALYSDADRTRAWTAFTASMYANADGSETLARYAETYRDVARRRTLAMQELARTTLDTVLPLASGLLTAAQRAQVTAAIDAEQRPAAIVDTLQSALRAASPPAAARFKELVDEQETIGGYADGEQLRAEDERQVLALWQQARAFLARRYGGYAVDIAALVPARPSITPAADSAAAISGDVSIGLKKPWPKMSLSSTLLHEMKHAIDQRSQAAVEGAAIEGASTLVERMVWPDFVREAMASEASRLPLARLLTEVDNVRFTATTDATLQILMRRTCAETEPDTIEMARGIVASYGYSDEPTLSLRSKRAHNSTQYLSYDYGLVKYGELVDYFQAAVGSQARVDPFLLQACGMPSPKLNAESRERLRACLAARRP